MVHTASVISMMFAESANPALMCHALGIFGTNQLAVSPMKPPQAWQLSSSSPCPMASVPSWWPSRATWTSSSRR